MASSTDHRTLRQPSTVRNSSAEPQLASDTDEESDYSAIIQSPTTHLLYNIENLDRERRELVQELFRPQPRESTPQLVLEWCGFGAEPEVYFFKMHELVDYTIRIGSSDSRYALPRCNCMDAAGDRPCRHLIWLADQLIKQTLHSHDPDTELELTDGGLPVQLGNPYERVSAFHIAALADVLHCDDKDPSDYTQPNPHRVTEVREILAGLAGLVQNEQVDSYRGDLFPIPDHPHPLTSGGEEEEEEEDIITPGDLEHTLLRLLLRNNEFFNMFLKLLTPRDKVHDPFRKLQQRARRVLSDLKAYSRVQQNQSTAATATDSTLQDPSRSRTEGPNNVAWAAQHLTSIVSSIHTLLLKPLENWQRESAARTLVWILKAVVEDHARDAHRGPTKDDRNLYHRLIGNVSQGPAFAVDVLRLLPDQVAFIDHLAEVAERIGKLGYQESFKASLDEVISAMRSHSPSLGGSSVPARETPREPRAGPPPPSSSSRGGAGLKRSATYDRSAKRMR